MSTSASMPIYRANSVFTTALRRPIASKQLYYGFQSRRGYSRLVKAFVSKHVEAWTDIVRPLATVTSGLTPVPAPSEKEKLKTASNEQEVRLSDEDSLSESSKAAITTDLRYMMRHVPHPVAIITATNPSAKTLKETYRGMTVSTYNTVTLYPEPVISFNVKTPSETYNAICQSKRFLVHLLSPKPSTARLARDFARGNEYLDPEHASCMFNFVSPDYEKNSKQLIAVNEGEPPMLMLKGSMARHSSGNLGAKEDTADTPDFPFILECRSLPQNLRVGSHVVVLGRVMRILRPGERKTSDDPTRNHSVDELCLAYADTRFWQVAKTIDPIKDGQELAPKK
ncbi:Flavin reductase-like, FMN-binding protein [Ascosphaera apis ARSEF 7405]|uniref:Flavin reductase-like, FMN-binding protein n=1 Tax=Ascosphaera apis ARSEF 7405 TaxID=392613 RepID=A0A167WLY1_9EURO|nr:Flavin reductase-like, FMN-binding protein [Ascosphaera apis ARSEF 7405]